MRAASACEIQSPGTKEVDEYWVDKVNLFNYFPSEGLRKPPKIG